MLFSKSYTTSQCKLIIQIVPDWISLFQWRQLHETFLAQLANHSDYERNIRVHAYTNIDVYEIVK